MSQRSILAGQHPTVVIKVGASVTVKGVESDRVTATTGDRWGLKVEKYSEAEFARARAAVGEVVLFDLRFNRPHFQAANAPEEVVAVQMGGSGEVLVPLGSNLKIYAGKDIDVQRIRGQVDAFSGLKLKLQEVYRLGHASAGGSMSLDCQTMRGDQVEFTAGGDLRFHIRELTGARIRVKDLAGFWEARIGDEARSIALRAGGDVTLVTAENVEPLPPHFILGKIETPSSL